jgi:hypothetical protein
MAEQHNPKPGCLTNVLLFIAAVSAGLFVWPFLFHMARMQKRAELIWFGLMYMIPLTVILAGIAIPDGPARAGLALQTTGVVLIPIFWVIGAIHSVRLYNSYIGNPESQPQKPATSPSPVLRTHSNDNQRLNHLQALRNTIRHWHEEGLLSIEIAGPVMDVADDEMAALRRAHVAVHVPVAAATPKPEPIEAPAPRAQIERKPLPSQAPSPAPIPATPAFVEPAGPAFSWRDIGTYILSERTLIALLALGALMVLISGFVISIFNPTELRPVFHLGAVAATALIFIATGYAVRTRLDLVRTGEVLLAIGGGFVPLTIWTLGGEQLLDWSSSTIWLVASLVGLAVYTAGYAALEDRAFSALIAIAGGSVVLSTFAQAQIPLEWGLCAVIALATLYLVLSRRLLPVRDTLAQSLLWSSLIVVPSIMIGLMVIAFFPQGWDILYGREQDLSPYAVGTAWWVGALFYFIGYRVYESRAFQYAGAWIVPFAYLFTLTEAPWSSSWYNLGLAVLAAAYLLANREFRGAHRLENWKTALARPELQVAFSLTLIAAIWPFASIDSAIPTLYLIVALYAIAAYRIQIRELQYLATYLLPVAFSVMLVKFNRINLSGFDPNWVGFWLVVLAGAYVALGYWWFTRASTSEDRFQPGALVREPIYQVALILSAIAVAWPVKAFSSEALMYLVSATTFGLAAVLLKQRLLAYASAFLLLISFGSAVEWAAFASDVRVLVWAIGSIALLIVAEALARKSREWQRPVLETVFGTGHWDSKFASPLFLAGFAAGGIALVLTVPILGRATAHAGGALELTGVHSAALFALVASYVITAVMRRTSLLLYPAVALLLLPATSTILSVFLAREIAWTESRFGLVLAAFGLMYFAIALISDRAGGHYAKPVYMVGYALTVISVGYASFDRATIVFVLGLSIVIYATSALMVHRQRHPSFQWGVDLLFPGRDSEFHKTTQNLFLYSALWLFPVWVALTMSLRDSLAGPGQYGMAFALLAPLYLVLGVKFKAIRTDYSIPWYAGGLALSAIGPLLTLDSPTLRIIALGVSIGMYSVIAYVSRTPIWTALVALLLPVWLWQVLDRFDYSEQYFGLSLVVLSLVYGTIALAIHHGGIQQAFKSVERPVRGLAMPFLVAAYVINIIGIFSVPIPALDQTVLALSMGAILYGGSILFLRTSLFAYPFVFMTVMAYSTVLDLVQINERFYGIGMLPGVFALFFAAMLIRRSNWVEQVNKPRFARYLGLNKVEAPFLIATYAGAAIAVLVSNSDWTVASVSLWSVAALLALSVYAFRSPTWLYPAYGSAAVAFLSTVHAIMPDLSWPTVIATLAVPSWAALWASYALALRIESSHSSPRWPDFGSERAFGYRWSRPLLVSGTITLVVTLIGSASEADAGFAAALLATVLIGALATLWKGRVEASLSLVLATLALQQSLRLLEVDLVNQAPVWAAGAVLVGLGSLILRALRGETAAAWFPVLSNGSVVLGAAAVIFATAVQLTELNRSALDPLSLAVTSFGIVLVTYAYVHVSRIPAYIGVASVLTAYTLRLVVLEVSEPQAFALPAGIYFLGIAFNEWRRGTGGDIRHMLEIAGVTLILGTSAIQSLGMLGAGEERYEYALLLMVQALGIFGLSAIVHWRIAFFAGISGTVVSIAVFLEQPLRSMNTWYLVLIIGVIMLIVVGFIERRRQEIPVWFGDWRKRLESWS